MVDRPAGRKRHSRPTPLLGGVGVYLAAVGSYALFARLDHRVLWLIAGASVVLVLGLVDDRLALRARFRLAVQLLSAGGIVAAGVHFDWFPWAVANYAVSILWLVGLVNAINCLDCADGIAAGVAAVAAGAFFLVAIANGHFAVALMAIALLGGCMGFLAFNFPPASIFLGDAGSASLGFLLGGLAIASSFGTSPLQQAWITALPLAIPICDIAMVHLRRYRAGTRNLRDLLESSGRDHLPHRLARLGLGPRQVAATVYLMAVLLAVPAVLMVDHQLVTLPLAVEIALLTLIAGERRFGALVARLSRLGPRAPAVARLIPRPTETVSVQARSAASAGFE
jgi:UDP-GlcNAc:undecaprenyl-phosphate GlcNAc-1-phosphate transferase